MQLLLNEHGDPSFSFPNLSSHNINKQLAKVEKNLKVGSKFQWNDLKFHIQSRFLYKKIICTRKTRVICMNVRCMYKKFTNIFRCRMSKNIMQVR